MFNLTLQKTNILHIAHLILFEYNNLKETIVFFRWLRSHKIVLIEVTEPVKTVLIEVTKPVQNRINYGS